MALPDWYKPQKVDSLYEPDLQRAYQSGLAAFQKPAAADSTRVLLWLVDMQVDFIYPAPVGRLPVPGALDDTRRVADWIYRNMHQLTHIAASLDTHTPLQIFYPSWWKDQAGQAPAPYTVISAQDVQERRWLAALPDAQEWSMHYVQALEQVGKKQLMIWPFHCMEGTNGRALHPALSEALMFHSGARQTDPTFLTKGTIPFTEFYSVLEPEVKYADHPDGVLNMKFLQFLGDFDLVYVAGEARSHCVLETVQSIMRHYAGRPAVIGKFRFLDDCTSSITGFEAPTEDRLGEFRAQGLHFVRAADPVG